MLWKNKTLEIFYVLRKYIKLEQYWKKIEKKMTKLVPPILVVLILVPDYLKLTKLVPPILVVLILVPDYLKLTKF